MASLIPKPHFIHLLFLMLLQHVEIIITMETQTLHHKFHADKSDYFFSNLSTASFKTAAFL